MIFWRFGRCCPRKQQTWPPSSVRKVGGRLILSTFWQAFDMFLARTLIPARRPPKPLVFKQSWAPSIYLKPAVFTAIFDLTSFVCVWRALQSSNHASHACCAHAMMHMVWAWSWHGSGATALKWTSLTIWWWTNRFTNDSNHDSLVVLVIGNHSWSLLWTLWK